MAQIKDKMMGFLGYWGISVAVLFLPYWGLYIMGFHPVPLEKVLAAVAVLGIAFALLLQVDKQTGTASQETQRLTPWGLIHELFVTRKPLLAAFALALAATAMATYYLSISLFSLEFEPESASIVIGLPIGQKDYYTVISPYGAGTDVGGWQNTNIFLQKDESFTVRLSGSVNPGYLQEVVKLDENMDAIRKWVAAGHKTPMPPGPKIVTWDFTGPEGYDPDWYPPNGRNLKPYIKTNFNEDDGLTVKGRPHNRVLGIIKPAGEKPRRALGLGDAPGVKNPQPGYDWANGNDRAELIDLSSPEYPIHPLARNEGYLWVVINDADDFRWDNVGYFVLKLTRQPGILRGLTPASRP